jgi:hypothetical protein
MDGIGAVKSAGASRDHEMKIRYSHSLSRPR